MIVVGLFHSKRFYDSMKVFERGCMQKWLATTAVSFAYFALSCWFAVRHTTRLIWTDCRLFWGLLLDCHSEGRETGWAGEKIKMLHIILIFHRRAWVNGEISMIYTFIKKVITAKRSSHLHTRCSNEPLWFCRSKMTAKQYCWPVRDTRWRPW